MYLLSHEERRVEARLAELAESTGFALYAWRATRGISGPDAQVIADSQDVVAALDAVLEISDPALFVFFDFHTALREPLVVRQVRDLEPVLAARGQALVIVSPVLFVPTELEKDVTVLDVDLPDAAEVGRLIDEVVARDDLPVDNVDRDGLSQAALGLTTSEIRRVFARIRLSGGVLDSEDISSVVDEKRRVIRKSRFLEFTDVGDGMRSVGGMENLKRWLEARRAGFREEARNFGLPSPKGLFLLGVQGCGKSLMSKAVADHWKMPLLRLDLGAVFQSAERAEESLRETIRVAERLAPVVLWIDELEKGFATTDAAAGRALGSFLTWMQEKTAPVFVVATANDVRSLPPELLRKGRFDEIFFVDLPNVHERLEILEIHLGRLGRDAEKFDLPTLAEETEKFSGAELEQLIIAALYQAFSEQREVDSADLLETARDMIPLAITMDDHLKALREWARPRARPASVDRRRVDFFEEWGA
jgi:AAA+ superfamily predicted ATPase